VDEVECDNPTTLTIDTPPSLTNLLPFSPPTPHPIDSKYGSSNISLDADDADEYQPPTDNPPSDDDFDDGSSDSICSSNSSSDEEDSDSSDVEFVVVEEGKVGSAEGATGPRPTDPVTNPWNKQERRPIQVTRVGAAANDSGSGKGGRGAGGKEKKVKGKKVKGKKKKKTKGVKNAEGGKTDKGEEERKKKSKKVRCRGCCFEMKRYPTNEK
jgi:hypothetical protein